jgi:hypothetical protein
MRSNISVFLFQGSDDLIRPLIQATTGEAFPGFDLLTKANPLSGLVASHVETITHDLFVSGSFILKLITENLLHFFAMLFGFKFSIIDVIDDLIIAHAFGTKIIDQRED